MTDSSNAVTVRNLLLRRREELKQEFERKREEEEKKVLEKQKLKEQEDEKWILKNNKWLVLLHQRVKKKFMDCIEQNPDETVVWVRIGQSDDSDDSIDQDAIYSYNNMFIKDARRFCYIKKYFTNLGYGCSDTPIEVIIELSIV